MEEWFKVVSRPKVCRKSIALIFYILFCYLAHDHRDLILSFEF